MHNDRKQYCCDDKARKQQLYRGLRQWHDTRWKTCELGRSIELFAMKYIETSRKGQESMDGSMEVGLIGSTRRAGKPSTWGSDQQMCDSLNENIYAIHRDWGTHMNKLKLIAENSVKALLKSRMWENHKYGSEVGPAGKPRRSTRQSP